MLLFCTTYVTFGLVICSYHEKLTYVCAYRSCQLFFTSLARNRFLLSSSLEIFTRKYFLHKSWIKIHINALELPSFTIFWLKHYWALFMSVTYLWYRLAKYNILAVYSRINCYLSFTSSARARACVCAINILTLSPISLIRIMLLVTVNSRWFGIVLEKYRTDKN